MQYRSGTCSVVNGSNVVTFAGNTGDATQVAIGDQFKLDLNGDAIYQVASRTPSAGITLTSLTLSAPYGGDTVAGTDYQIVSDFSVSRGYPLLAQGDMDAADWLSKIVMMIDTDLGALLGSTGVGSVSSIAVGSLIYRSSGGFTASPINYDDVAGTIGIGTSTHDLPARVTLKGGAQAIGGYQLSLEEPGIGGYGVGLAFRQNDNDAITKVTAAKIVVDGSSSWTGEANRTSRMSFWTIDEGALAEHMRLTGKGALIVGVTDDPLCNAAPLGTIGMANDNSLKAALFDGSGWASLIKLDINNVVTIGADGNGVRFGEPLKALGDGAQATLQWIGGDGPVSTQQYAWRRFVSDDGSFEYHPVWK